MIKKGFMFLYTLICVCLISTQVASKEDPAPWPWPFQCVNTQLYGTWSGYVNSVELLHHQNKYLLDISLEKSQDNLPNTDKNKKGFFLNIFKGDFSENDSEYFYFNSKGQQWFYSFYNIEHRDNYSKQYPKVVSTNEKLENNEHSLAVSSTQKIVFGRTIVAQELRINSILFNDQSNYDLSCGNSNSSSNPLKDIRIRFSMSKKDFKAGNYGKGDTVHFVIYK